MEKAPRAPYPVRIDETSEGRNSQHCKMADADIDAQLDSGRSSAAIPTIMVGAATGLLGVALLFWLASRFDWTIGWIFLGLCAAHVTMCMSCIYVWNRPLFGRRMRIGANTKKWDLIWSAIFRPAMVAVFIVASFDINFRVEDPGSPWLMWLLGASIFVVGWMLLTWTMVSNPFFEQTVRIQTDHGHHVIDKGPYTFIRHPGYVGISAVLLATPLLLAAAWPALPAVFSVLGLVLRTWLEDRTLQAELPGYREYAERVRFRLVPGVW